MIGCWRVDDEFSWNNFYFIVVKEFWYGKNHMENLFQYYLWILLWILTSLVIWHLNITVSTTLYCYKNALNKKLKFMGGSMKYFPKKLMGHEIFRSMVSCTTKIFFQKFVKPSVPQPPPTYLTYGPLRKETFFPVTNFCITLSL